MARTGLIFTRIQEGEQPGGLTPPGQTEPGIPYHVPSRWVPVGEAAQQEFTRGSGGHSGGAVRESGSVCGFILYFLLICIVVVIVHFSCCSVKLPLSRPTSFCLFISIFLRSPAGGGAAVWRFVAGCSRNQNIQS